MRQRTLAVLVLSLPIMTTPAFSQGPTEHPLITSAPREARQFDFLVGQWELVGEPGLPTLVAFFHGTPKFPGTWRASRALDGFGIEDDLRLSDPSGNPQVFIHSVRAYDATAHQWNQATTDVYRARANNGTGQWKDGAMTSLAHSTDAEGKPLLVRSRFSAINPNSFKWQQDVSYDEGRTWTEGKLKIEAKRVAVVAPR
jgi:hypothetical protein